jgi:uncharacterized protein YkwD
MKIFIIVVLSLINFVNAQKIDWSIVDEKLGYNPDVETFNGIILKYVNDYRKVNGLRKLQYDNSAYHMIQKQVNHCYLKLKLSHERNYLDGVDLITDFHSHVKKYLGDTYDIANENLGSVYHQNIEEYTYDELAYFIFNAWKNSQSHNAAMLVKEHIKASVASIMVINEGDGMDRIYSGIVIWH